MYTRYKAYEQEDGVLLTTAENTAALMASGLLSERDRLLYEFDADSPEEANAIHHLRQGWQPYRAAGEPAECPRCGAIYYPDGSGVCWCCGKVG